MVIVCISWQKFFLDFVALAVGTPLLNSLIEEICANALACSAGFDFTEGSQCCLWKLGGAERNVGKDLGCHKFEEDKLEINSTRTSFVFCLRLNSVFQDPKFSPPSCTHIGTYIHMRNLGKVILLPLVK